MTLIIFYAPLTVLSMQLTPEQCNRLTPDEKQFLNEQFIYNQFALSEQSPHFQTNHNNQDIIPEAWKKAAQERLNKKHNSNDCE